MLTCNYYDSARLNRVFLRHGQPRFKLIIVLAFLDYFVFIEHGCGIAVRGQVSFCGKIGGDIRDGDMK